MGSPPNWILFCAMMGCCLMSLGGASHVFGPEIGNVITRVTLYGFGLFSGILVTKRST